MQQFHKHACMRIGFWVDAVATPTRNASTFRDQYSRRIIVNSIRIRNHSSTTQHCRHRVPDSRPGVGAASSAAAAGGLAWPATAWAGGTISLGERVTAPSLVSPGTPLFSKPGLVFHPR